MLYKVKKMERVLVGFVDDFDDSVPESVEINDKLILVVKIDDKFYAVDAICTHQEVELTDGKILRFEGKCPQIVCPAHLGRFDLCTGKAVYKPPKKPLNTYEVEINDNQVFIVILDSD